MAQIKLFDTWTYAKEIPEPFSKFMKELKIRKTTFEAEWLSQYNDGKQATLHPATLYAVLAVAKIYLRQFSGAIGIQRGNNGLLNFYCMEYPKGGDTYALIYNPISARMHGSVVSDQKAFSSLPAVSQKESDGQEILAMLVYVSLEKEEAFYNLEFAQNFVTLAKEMQDGWPDPKNALKAAFLCCDNLYRRMENVSAYPNEEIPFDKSQLDQDGIEMLSPLAVRSQLYAPNTAIKGKFEILGEEEKARSWTLKELKEVYGQNWDVPSQYRNKIPALPEDMRVGEYAQDILSAIVESPFRKFMVTGDAGTGKTTDAQIIAQILGVPYFALNCGPDTDENKLVVSIYPNSRKQFREKIEMPTLKEFVNAPGKAVEKLGGYLNENATQSEAFRTLLERAAQAGYQKAKAEGNYVMQESEIITGCRMPAVIEIMEASLITEPGTLGALNRLLDDSKQIDLIYGETIVRDPNAIIFITTNLNYVANREMDFSVISRMNKVQHRKPLTAEELVDRVMYRTGCREKDMLRKMADMFIKMGELMKTEFGKKGVCGYREFENWTIEYMRLNNVIKAAEDTVLSKLSTDEEDRALIRASCMSLFQAA